MFRSPSLSFLVGSALAGALLACSPSPVEVEISRTLSLSKAATEPDVHVLHCTPRSAASGSAIIGPGGGTVRIGPHRLIIPEGALAKRVLIQGSSPSDTVASVSFSPAGLQFAIGHPATLRLDYSNCTHLPVTRHIVYTTDDLQVLEAEPSKDWDSYSVVDGLVSHFSRYAIAW